MSIQFSRRMSVVIGIVAALALSSVANKAQAAFYGDFIGPNIMFLDVEEDPDRVPGPDPVELFGPPTLTPGEMLDFDPMDFDAGAANGMVEMTNSLLCTTIMAQPGQFIGQIYYFEKGGYEVMGNTALTHASVSIDAYDLTVVEINGLPVVPFSVPMNIVYTNLGGALDSTASGGMHFYGDGNGMWTASATANLPAGVTKVEFCIDNMLDARSEGPGTLAFIDKKQAYIDVNPVPEPSTILLGAMGFVGLVVGGRKMRKAKA